MTICSGCQPARMEGVKHKSSPMHSCRGNGCLCDLCNPEMAWHPVSDEQYTTWVTAMGKLGEFYVENTKTLIQMVKQKKLKPNMPEKEKE